MTFTFIDPAAAVDPLAIPPGRIGDPVPRIMGDATSKNVGELVKRARELELVGVYVTGSPDVQWTGQQRELFPGPRWQQVTIDQGFTGSPVPGALVRDVEAGAWTPDGAVKTPWDNPRKTIYISIDRLGELERAGWRGRVWVAHWTGARPSVAPAVPAGMTCVAQQYANPESGSGGPYDLSAVFAADWPEPARPANKPIPAPPRHGISAACTVLSDDGRIYLMVWDERSDKWTTPAGTWPVAD